MTASKNDDPVVPACRHDTQSRALDRFVPAPLAVVTAGNGHDAAWLSAQDRLATLSSNVMHRDIPGATHALRREAESDAGASSRAFVVSPHRYVPGNPCEITTAPDVDPRTPRNAAPPAAAPTGQRQR